MTLNAIVNQNQQFLIQWLNRRSSRNDSNSNNRRPHLHPSLNREVSSRHCNRNNSNIWNNSSSTYLNSYTSTNKNNSSSSSRQSPFECFSTRYNQKPETKSAYFSDSNGSRLNFHQLKPEAQVIKAKRFSVVEATDKIPNIDYHTNVKDIVFCRVMWFGE